MLTQHFILYTSGTIYLRSICGLCEEVKSRTNVHSTQKGHNQDSDEQTWLWGDVVNHCSAEPPYFGACVHVKTLAELCMTSVPYVNPIWLILQRFAITLSTWSFKDLQVPVSVGTDFSWWCQGPPWTLSPQSHKEIHRDKPCRVFSFKLVFNHHFILFHSHWWI